jgi:lysozyme
MYQLSTDGLLAIERRENPGPTFEPCLTAYRDGKGANFTWTIGTGHTGPEVHEGLVWTPEQCATALNADTAEAQAAINRLVTVPLKQNQYDALVSFVFQIGAGNFEKSTALKVLNKGNYDAVPAAMAQWKYANHDYSAPNPGVQNRRASEAGQWAGGSHVASASVDVSPPPSAVKRAHTWLVGSGLTAIASNLWSGLSDDKLQDAGQKLLDLGAHGHGFVIIGLTLIVAGIFWKWQKDAHS